MIQTVKELITANLVAAVEGIAVIIGANNDVTAEVNQIRGNPAKDRKVLVLDDGDTPMSDHPQHKDDYTANYSLVCMVATSESNATPVDTERSRLVADVRKALMEDWTRGANAINTIIGSNSTLADGVKDGYSGDVLSVSVHYRTAKDDPYSL